MAKPVMDAMNTAYKWIMAISEDPIKGDKNKQDVKLNAIIKAQEAIWKIQKPLYVYWNICNDPDEPGMHAKSTGKRATLCDQLNDVLKMLHAMQVASPVYDPAADKGMRYIMYYQEKDIKNAMFLKAVQKFHRFTSGKLIKLSYGMKMAEGDLIQTLITPIRIADRVVQRVLCDYALVPIMESRLIYDNSASRKDMGVDFARRRFNVMLERAKAKWGNDFYALSFDFKSYFDSIPHKLCMEELDASFRDKRIADISMQVIESYQKRDAMLSGDTELLERLNRHDGVGICLGSQVSQIMALAAPNKIDHYLKDVLGIQEAIRYMDDGQILHQDKNYLKAVLAKLEEMAKSCGLRLNPKKTRITHIRHGITFLKIRYTIRGMKTIRKMVKAGKVRMQKKLKKLVHFVRDRVLDAMDVYASLQSWAEHASRAMSFHARRRMAILYDQLYRASPGYRRYALT